MLLTVCVALRGSQPLLHECIDSVRPVADEIVLLEPAGCITDGLADLHRLPFDGNPWTALDDALNAAVFAAGGEWLLFLEGHERLDELGGDMRAALSAAEGDAFSLRLRRLTVRLHLNGRPVAHDHPLAHGALSSRDHRGVRLFRRRSGIRFGGRIDPSVEDSLRALGVRADRGPWSVLQHDALIPAPLYQPGSRLERSRDFAEQHPRSASAWIDFGRRLLADAGSPSSIDCFLEAWRLEHNASAALEAVRALALEARFEDALALLERAAAGAMDDEGAREADIAEARGEMLRELGRHGEAVDAYQTAIGLASDKPVARIGLVEALCMQGRGDEALRHAEWLCRHYPGLAQSWIAAALVQMLQGHILSAIQSLNTAVDIDPASVVAHYHLSACYTRLGARGAAEKALSRAGTLKGGIAAKDFDIRSPAPPGLDLKPLGEGGVISFIPALAGGAGRVAVDLIRCLAPSHPQALITYDQRDHYGMNLVQELAELDVPILSIGNGGQLTPIQQILDPAVIVFHSDLPQDMIPPAVSDAVLVSVSHGRNPFGASHHDLYVCLSDSHRRRHAYLPDERVCIIPNGVELTRFEGAELDATAWGKKQDADVVRIAMLTRLDPAKCARRLLHYLEPLHDLNVRIAIAGNGPRRWEIEPDRARFRIGPKVRFAGPLPSRAVPSFLAAADIGLHLTETDSETLSVSILEMLAAGLPIVSQPRGCLPELIDHGKNGFLFESEAEISTALRELVLSPELRGAMAKASRNRAADYAMPRFNERWRSLVDKCVALRAERRKRVRHRRSVSRAPRVPAKARALVGQLQANRSAEHPPSYLIATTHRVGCTWISTALSATRVVGCPKEDFAPWFFSFQGRSWRYANLDEYLLRRWQMAASSRGVYGSRLMFEHLVALCGTHGTPDWPQQWLKRVGCPAWIFLRRRDRVAQAISLYKAEASGLWWYSGDPKIGARVIPYDRKAIDDCRRRLECDDRAWQAFFTAFDLRPLELFYEDVVTDFEGSVRAILDRIGVAPPDPLYCRGKTLRQADDETLQWKARFASGG